MFCVVNTSQQHVSSVSSIDNTSHIWRWILTCFSFTNILRTPRMTKQTNNSHQELQWQSRCWEQFRSGALVSATLPVLWWISRVRQGGIKGTVIAIIAMCQRVWLFVQTRNVGRWQGRRRQQQGRRRRRLVQWPWHQWHTSKEATQIDENSTILFIQEVNNLKRG